MARYSQTALIDEMERVIAVGGEELRSAVFMYVTKTVGLTNAQAASIMQGGALNKFSEQFLVQLAGFLAPKMSEDMRQVVTTLSPPDAENLNIFKARKARFLQEVYNDNPPPCAKATFAHMFRSYETPSNKDICEATKEELINALGDTVTPNKRTIQNSCGILREYFVWCDRKGFSVPHKDDLIELRVENIDFSRSIASTLLSGPDEFAALLGRLPSSTDPRMIVVIILCWLGFTHQEIRDLKEGDVDEKAGTVWNPYFKLIQIPDVLTRPFWMYSALLDSEEYCRDADEPYIKRFDRSPDLRGQAVHLNTLRQGISNVNNEIRRIPNMNYNITTRGFAVAGAFWKLRELEASGKTLTFTDFGYYLRSNSAKTSAKYQWKSLYENFCNIYFG